ncbi:conserved hypothetical protein [Cenarchaeum symbiosum A]|uniref:Uncharacterized protein n=1 Tax=Cenarchaeum symbiosum (strain A) TaxID=414004 RepID=A0RY38_CENSY|nr:conserved hypothetical protein [Cenarchaeum symbiosum A]
MIRLGSCIMRGNGATETPCRTCSKRRSIRKARDWQELGCSRTRLPVPGCPATDRPSLTGNARGCGDGPARKPRRTKAWAAISFRLRVFRPFYPKSADS